MRSFFVSSTFKDMQIERDVLHHQVLPYLKDEARVHGENFRLVDLRWGISTQDLDTDEGARKILNHCLTEIENCEPYMIILLGERYGWCPDDTLIRDAAKEKYFHPESSSISVTELEIQYGMWLNRNQLNNCYFCMRAPMDQTHMTEEQKHIYLSGSEEDSRRMELLKEKIRAEKQAKIIEYSLDWNEQTQSFDGSVFGSKLLTCLQRNLKREWGSEKELASAWYLKKYKKIVKERVWWDYQKAFDSVLFEQHLLHFGCREEELIRLYSAVETKKLIDVNGKNGSGKSALMSALADRLRKAGKRCELIFCGNFAYCNSLEQLLQMLCYYLETEEEFDRARNSIYGSHLYGEIIETEDGAKKWEKEWNRLCAEYDGKPMTMIIDGLETLRVDQALFQSLFIPESLSEKLTLVITRTPEFPINFIRLSNYSVKKYLSYDLPLPTKEERRLIARHMFASEFKEISDDVADAIVEKPLSENMLLLDMMVFRLANLTETDFAKITELEKTMDGDTAIRMYLLNIISDFSSETSQFILDFFFHISDELFKSRDGNEGKNMMVLPGVLSCFHRGINKEEVQKIQSYINDYFIAKGIGSLPDDSPWRNFWRLPEYNRMRKYLERYISEDIRGNIGFLHPMISQNLAARAFYIADFLSYILCDASMEEMDFPYENELYLLRLYYQNAPKEETRKNERYLGLRIVALNACYLCNKDGEEEEKGLHRRRLLLDGILSDLFCEDGFENLNVYCSLLDLCIDAKTTPLHWHVDFFARDVVNFLLNYGNKYKAMGLQFLLRVIASFTAPERRAGIYERFDLSELKRLAFLYENAMSGYKNLWPVLKSGEIRILSYGLSYETLYDAGMQYMKECIMRHPEESYFYEMRAKFEANFVVTAARDAKTVFFRGRIEKYTEMCIEDALKKIERDDKAKEVDAARVSQAISDAILFSQETKYYPAISKRQRKWLEENQRLIALYKDKKTGMYVTAALRAALAEGMLLFRVGQREECIHRVWPVYKEFSAISEIYDDMYFRSILQELVNLMLEAFHMNNWITFEKEGDGVNMIMEIIRREEAYFTYVKHIDIQTRFYWANLILEKWKHQRGPGSVKELKEVLQIYEYTSTTSASFSLIKNDLKDKKKYVEELILNHTGYLLKIANDPNAFEQRNYTKQAIIKLLLEAAEYADKEGKTKEADACYKEWMLKTVILLSQERHLEQNEFVGLGASLLKAQHRLSAIPDLTDKDRELWYLGLLLCMEYYTKSKNWKQSELYSTAGMEVESNISDEFKKASVSFGQVPFYSNRVQTLFHLREYEKSLSIIPLYKEAVIKKMGGEDSHLFLPYFLEGVMHQRLKHHEASLFAFQKALVFEKMKPDGGSQEMIDLINNGIHFEAKQLKEEAMLD